MRAKGLEPPRREALDPKSSAATNYATPAGSVIGIAKVNIFFTNAKKIFVKISVRFKMKLKTASNFAITHYFTTFAHYFPEV